MTALRNAAQQALEALKDVQDLRPNDKTANAITALRAALAEREQPYDGYGSRDELIQQIEAQAKSIAHWRDQALTQRTEPVQEPLALNTHPPQRKPLTDGEIENIAVNLADAEIGRALKGEETNFSVEFARAIERAHGIGGEA